MDCIEREIVEAGYRSLARKAHPDSEGGSHEKMVALTGARDWLFAVTDYFVPLKGQKVHIITDEQLTQMFAGGQADQVGRAIKEANKFLTRLQNLGKRTKRKK